MVDLLGFKGDFMGFHQPKCLFLFAFHQRQWVPDARNVMISHGSSRAKVWVCEEAEKVIRASRTWICLGSHEKNHSSTR